MSRLVVSALACLAAASSLSAQARHSVTIALDPPGGSKRELRAGVGDPRAAAFKPVLRLSGWDESAFIEISLVDPAVGFASLELLPDAKGRDRACITAASLSHEVFRVDSTGLEWGMVLDEPPPDGRLVFPIVVSGLTLYYQDSLTAYERDSLGCRRSDSVVGSYAVYRTTNTGRPQARDKAFHLFRPRAWNALGDTVWCDLHVDMMASVLCITLPKSLLLPAGYPVVVDPTFGSSVAGASGLYLGPGHVRHCRFPMGAAAGLADSIACYVHSDGTLDSLGVALYADSASNPTTLLAPCAQRQISVTWTTRWYSFALANHVELQPSSYYWLSLFASAGAYLQYDDLGEGTSEGHFADPWPPSDPAGRDWSELDYTFSIYCAYTAAGEAPAVNRRRRLCGGR